MLLFLAIFIALYDLNFRWKFKILYPPLQNSGFNILAFITIICVSLSSERNMLPGDLWWSWHGMTQWNIIYLFIYVFLPEQIEGSGGMFNCCKSYQPLKPVFSPIRCIWFILDLACRYYRLTTVKRASSATVVLWIHTWPDTLPYEFPFEA